MFAAGVLRASVLVDGHAARQVLENVEIAATIISIGMLFRWAVLHERRKPPADKG
jgi:hypothetical protein